MSNQNPKVSVIIPTYNRAKLLPRTINSVLNQTFQDFELIIVDDGSTDNTKEVIKGFQNKDERIKYVYQNNQGESGARNTGLRESQGEYVAFLDSDDEWLPEKLEKELELFKRSDRKHLGFVSCNALIKKGDGIREYKTPRYKNNFKELLKRNFICSPSSVLIKNKVFNSVGVFDKKLKIGPDWDMWIRIAREYDFDFVPEPLFKYYIHGNNITKTLSLSKKERNLKYIFQKYKKYYEQNPKIYSAKLRYDGTRYVLAKQLRKGRMSFLKSIRLDPLNFKSYIYLLLSLGGSNFYYQLTQLKMRLKMFRIFDKI